VREFRLQGNDHTVAGALHLGLRQTAQSALEIFQQVQAKKDVEKVLAATARLGG